MKIQKLDTKHMLILILLLAIVLRLPNINANFTGDEIDTVGPARSFAISGDFRELNECNGNPYYNYTHPPVRILLYSAWASVFGFSNIALRLLSTLFGITSIIIIYILGKELYSERVGIIAAFLAAISRYHIYGSNLVSTDTGHFMFTTSVTVLFFVMYLKKNSKKYFATSLAFSIISMMTKFSSIIIFIPIVVGGYLYRRKRATFVHIAATILISAVVMLGIATIFGDSRLFDEPIKAFFDYTQASGTSPSLNDYVYNKIFKIATISWQMTPFFAVLLLLSLKSLNKMNKNFIMMASWLTLGFLIIFMPYGQDIQRYFLMLLAPAFIIAAKYIEGIKFSGMSYSICAAIIVLATVIGLNDLMGYYQPIYLALFYTIALILLVHRKRLQLLVAGFVGLSIFFAFSGGVMQIGSQAIGQLSHDTSSYPYKEVWTTKDVSYYITPFNETVRNCNLWYIVRDYIKENNIKYVAFYSTVPRQNDIESIFQYCSQGNILVLRGYTMGFSCKLNMSTL